MNYEISKLRNGIRVVAAPLKERQSVSVGVWVHVGGRDEEPRLGGVSHFLEHIVFKGTATRTAHQIKETVEGVGGSLNAFTTEEYTCFLAKAQNRHFEKVLDVLADMVLNASIQEDDIHKERTVIMEEIKMTQDQPAQLVDEILSEAVWAGHALGRPLAGTLETVGALTQADIRNYRGRFYEASLITVVASGDIDQKRLARAAETVLGPAKNGAGKAVDLFQVRQSRPSVRLVKKDTEQMHLALGLHSFAKDHPDHHALDLLNIILGGNMSSRLFNEVREERGLAYDIGSFTRAYQETGAFVVSAGVDHRKLYEALEVILQQVEKTAEEPVRPDELERAKEFYLGQLELSLESSMNQMLWVGENIVCLGRFKTLEEVRRAVQKVTASDIQRVAGSLFRTSTLNLAVVGPLNGGSEEKLRRILAFSRG